MNWIIELDEAAQLVKVSVEGDFTLEDCFKMKEDFLSRDFWRAGINVLIDYRRTSFINLNLEIIRSAGAFHALNDDRIGGGKMAFLMRSPHHFGIARQYEMITDGKVLSQVCVFLDENKTYEWLNAVSVHN